MKLAPRCPVYAARRPGCDPLRDPTTLTDLISPLGGPRMLIWVEGEASGVPSEGEIASGAVDDATAGPAVASTPTTLAMRTRPSMK
jgi:hypothetical protein